MESAEWDECIRGSVCLCGVYKYSFVILYLFIITASKSIQPSL